MADYGHEKTEQQLAALEKRISAIYRDASKELKAKIENYFESFRARDERQKAKVVAGELSESKYKQ